MENLVIVGSGPAGYTSAIYSARAELKPLVIEGPTPGGQLVITPDLENFPGFPEGIDGYSFMDLLKKQAVKFGARSQIGSVKKLEYSDEVHRVTLADGTVVESKAVILATGSIARNMGLENELRLVGKGVSMCATCDGAFFRDKVCAVVGGGNTALEDAIFLTRFAKKVYLIHRRDEFRGEPVLQKQVKNNKKIELKLSCVLEDVLGEDKVKAIKIKHLKDNSMEELELEGLFIAVGHTPVSKLVKDTLPTDETGYVIQNSFTSKTEVPGLFVAGDVAESVYRQAIVAAGMGCMAALDAQKYIEELDS